MAWAEILRFFTISSTAGHPGKGDLERQPVVHRLPELDVGLPGEVEDPQQLPGAEAVGLAAEAVETVVGDVEDLLGGSGVLDEEERSQVVHQRPQELPRL